MSRVNYSNLKTQDRRDEPESLSGSLKRYESEQINPSEKRSSPAVKKNKKKYNHNLKLTIDISPYIQKLRGETSKEHTSLIKKEKKEEVEEDEEREHPHPSTPKD